MHRTVADQTTSLCLQNKAMEDPEPDTKNKSQGFRPVIMALLGAALLVSLGLAIGLGLGLRSLKHYSSTCALSGTPETVSPFKSRSGTYRYAAIASDADICSQIGIEILAVHQGSAVDAAVATVLCIGVVHRHNCGIGGGFFMTIYNRTTKSTYVLDARESAPLAANQSLYVGRGKDASTFGGLAIAVPGDIMGHWEAHQKFGRLPWKDLFSPTIKLCREGVPILPAIHKAMTQHENILRNMSHTMYFHPETGELLKIGDKIKYPALAKTLDIIAREGASAFYNSSLTDNIVNDIKDYDGIITKEDLNGYRARWRTPLSQSLGEDLLAHSLPPPSSGAVFEYILNILDGYNFTRDDLLTNDKKILTYHRIVEAMKFAYAKRTDLGDQDFEDVAELIKNMTSSDFGDTIRSQISDDHTHNMDCYGPTFYDQEKSGTSHASFIDVQGNAVSITSTINAYFGSKVYGSRTGIAFNNEMDDFSTPGLINAFGVKPSAANFIKAGKRPLSSTCPSIVVNRTSGDVVLAIGASGGTKITTATALVTLYALRLGVSIEEAVDHRRLHHQLIPQHVLAETGFPQEIIRGLKVKGHNVTFSSSKSVVNPIHVTDGMLHAVSDVRKGGAPSGY